MEFRILGPLEVRSDGGLVALGGAKPRALMAMLLLHANEPVSADRLAMAVWGEDAPARAVERVQVHVSRLRSALGDRDLVTSTVGGYRLRVRPGELDADRFEQAVAEGRGALAGGRPDLAATLLREALALWRGAPLSELACLPSGPTEIAQLEEQRLAALELRIEADLALGRHHELIAELQRLVAEHAWRERLQMQYMLALYRAGRQADALDAFRRARGVLVEQLGIEPGPELRALEQAILVHDPSLEPPRTSEAAPPRPDGALPASAGALFGREGDLDRLAKLVSALGTRLVTLVGPGGVGKTRLAIEAARRLAPDFADGARFVSLASTAAPAQIASTIAQALAVPVRADEAPVSAVRRFLGDRHMLLVLDNFEHLVAGAVLAAELLAAAPELKLLVTSREPTLLAAERLFPVRPLALPDADAGPSAADLERYGAVAMFLDRGRARDPEFAADEADLVHVLAVCRRLDGLPLALELAAARVGLLAPAELAARLDRALVVLTGGARDAPERQRTLRATIEWSTRLLSHTERAAFARMAVFPAGSTVAVAERVTGASLDTLDALVAKQLLARRGGRLVMLETVREYARERLAEDPERDNVTERLAHWAAAFAQEATSHLVRADRAVWLATLEAEVPNLLAALSLTVDAKRAELALDLAVALSEYWWRSNRGEDGLHWIEAVLPSTTAGAPRARATCLLYRARLAGARQTERFRADLEASLELFRTCDDIAATAACVGHLAIAEYWIGNDERAWVHRDEALRLAERVLGETAGASSFADEALVSAASIPAPSWEGTEDTARRVASHLRHSGHLVGLAQVGSVTGYFAITQRRYRDALGWLEDGLEAARRLEDLTLVYLILGNQGLARLFLDDLDDAEHAFRAGLALCRRAGCEDIVAEPLLGLAAVAARREDIERAAILHGAAIGRDEGSRSPEERTIWSRLTDEIIAPTRDRHAQRWERAVGTPPSLSASEAIELALRPTVTPPASLAG